MYLESLTVNNFRNLNKQKIEFTPGINYIYGDNAQGKTSIVEAIYLLAQGKSFRERKVKNLSQWDTNNFEVQGVFESQEIKKTINITYAKSKKSLYINENKIKSAAEFFGTFTAVSFSPDDLNIVKGPTSERRRFIDQIISMLNKNYVYNLVSYQRALKTRNILLQKNETSSLNPWNLILFKHGLEVARIRKEFVDKLSIVLEETYNYISNDNCRVSLSYKSEFLEEDNLDDLFKRNLEKDLRYKTTSSGVHRDDLSFLINDLNARGNCSQGQARSISLGAKIAAAKIIKDINNEDPVLLLDDVQSELDNFRLEKLFELLFSSDSQIIITATEEKNLAKLEHLKINYLRVENGALTA